MPRRCHCNRAGKGRPYQAGECVLCWQYHNDPRYRAHWDKPGNPERRPQATRPPPAATPALQPPCRYEGPVVTNCPRGEELLHVRQCLHDDADWDTCSRGFARDADRSCLGCPLRDVPPRPPADADGWTRHLLYHILPVAGNGRWQWNVSELRCRLPLFNGRRVAAVMTPTSIRYTARGPRPDGARVPLVLDPPEAVEKALAGCGFEFIRVPNDPNLREVASFEPLFSRVADLVRPGDVTLWAHAKGTTRRPDHVAERWAATLYEAMLDYWPVVAGVLRANPLAGCFKKRGPGWLASQSRSDWHYSGSWFWFRNEALFSQPDWKQIDRFWSGIEPYPSQHFHHDEAGVVFHEGPNSALNLYRVDYWDRVVTPEWEQWKQLNSANRTDIGSSATPSPP